MSRKPIDWEKLADALGTVTRTEHGYSEIGSADTAGAVLALMVGSDFIRDAVDANLRGGPGHELACHVLRILGSEVAIDHIMAIIRDPAEQCDDGYGRDYWATLLLADVFTPRVVEWLPELLAHPNPNVAGATFRLIEQMMFAETLEQQDALRLIRGVDDPAMTELVERYSATIEREMAFHHHFMAATTDYILLMHDDAPGPIDPEAWEPYVDRVGNQGVFKDECAMAASTTYRKGGDPAPATAGVIGYLRVRCIDLNEARGFLDGNPVYEAGGTVEIRVGKENEGLKAFQERLRHHH